MATWWAQLAAGIISTRGNSSLEQVFIGSVFFEEWRHNRPVSTHQFTLKTKRIRQLQAEKDPDDRSHRGLFLYGTKHRTRRKMRRIQLRVVLN